MKVSNKVTGLVFEVYGIYWYQGTSYFCYFPRETSGIATFREDEVEVVESGLGADFEYRPGDGMPGVFQKHLLRDRLLEDLYEHNPAAFAKFASLLGRTP